MNTDTPETDGEWNRLACQDHPEFERNLADFARKLERERDEARKIAAELREALQFVATDKIANAADMRCRAARALEFCPENEKSPCAGATKMKS